MVFIADLQWYIFESLFKPSLIRICLSDSCGQSECYGMEGFVIRRNFHIVMDTPGVDAGSGVFSCGK